MEICNEMTKDNSDATNDDTQTSIHDFLPNEILEQVLNKLVLESDLCNAKLVCRRWRYIVDDMIGHSFTVSNFLSLTRHLPYEDRQFIKLPGCVKTVDSLGEYPNLTWRELTIGVPALLIYDTLTELIKRISKEMAPFPEIDHGHLIKGLSLLEPVPSNIFSALGRLENLEYLNIGLISFTNLDAEENFKSLCTFRSLKTLIISETSSYPEFNSSSVVTALNNFLEYVKSPAVTSFEISYPIKSLLEAEGDSTRHVMNLIKTLHRLQKLTIGVCSPNQSFSPPSKLFQYPLQLLDEMEGLGKTIKLKSVELRDNHLHSLRPSCQTKAWIVFIKQQTQLRSLKLHLKSSIEFANDVVGILQSNADTLISLDLSCFPCEIEETGDIHFIPINGQKLKECSSLKSLKLADKTINTLGFPTTLSYICVDAMLTNADARNILISKSLHLKWVELKDSRGGAPKGFGYGVAIDTLRVFVKNRCIYRLTIYAGSTDGKFPNEGISNGDSVKPIRLRKRRVEVEAALNLISQQDAYQNPQSQIRIDWQLNERGFYDNINGTRDHDSDSDELKYDITGNIHHSMFTSSSLFSTFH